MVVWPKEGVTCMRVHPTVSATADGAQWTPCMNQSWAVRASGEVMVTVIYLNIDLFQFVMIASFTPLVHRSVATGARPAC